MTDTQREVVGTLATKEQVEAHQAPCGAGREVLRIALPCDLNVVLAVMQALDHLYAERGDSLRLRYSDDASSMVFEEVRAGW